MKKWVRVCVEKELCSGRGGNTTIKLGMMRIFYGSLQQE